MACMRMAKASRPSEASGNPDLSCSGAEDTPQLGEDPALHGTVPLRVHTPPWRGMPGGGYPDRSAHHYDAYRDVSSGPPELGLPRPESQNGAREFFGHWRA